MSREKKDFRGIAWLAQLVEPEEFTPRLHEHVQQALAGVLSRVKAAFIDEPVIYERLLEAMIGASDNSGNRRDDDTDQGAWGVADATAEVIAAIRPPTL